MAHVEIARSDKGGWSLKVDGAEIAPKISPDGLALRFEPSTLTWLMTVTVRAETLTADLPIVMIEALMAEQF